MQAAHFDWYGLFTVATSLLAILVLLSHATFFIKAGRDPLGFKISAVFFFGACVYVTTAIFGVLGMLNWPHEFMYIADITYKIRPFLVCADVIAGIMLFIEYKNVRGSK